MISFTAYANPDAEELARALEDEPTELAEMLSWLARLVTDRSGIADELASLPAADLAKTRAFLHDMLDACGEAE
jgi:hypothetical protein